ncbi:flavodoxin domain-containing protein [Natronobiforma cellulositropha]|uniref:flavodoxin domain-containing protein n=1 Tax=Natronobiforma cellulositropha TaxID=1679076 RepID=UPI0021D608C0|nr:flavodoxin domain-containing protein [Natronobiforma cellulositropha]
MSRVLVAYGSSEGQTAAIAERIGDTLAGLGHEVALVHVDHAPDSVSLSAYDGVVVAASVHREAHQRGVLEFARTHRRALSDRPSAFVSVSLTAAGAAETDERETRRYIDEFCADTGWTPDLTEPVAGALAYRRYGLLTRFVMRYIAGRKGLETDTSRDHEYTDWDAVDAFARRFSATLAGDGSDRGGSPTEDEP